MLTFAPIRAHSPHSSRARSRSRALTVYRRRQRRHRLAAGVCIAILGLGFLAAPLPALAQRGEKVPRIGFLGLGLSGPSLVGEAFRQGLRDLGYVEGRTIVIETRLAEGRAERLPDLARELVRLGVDVIVAAGPAIQVAKEATSTVPIVVANSGDPVAAGLVPSLSRPGGNITGLSTLSPELSAKRLQLLREAIHGLSSVAVLWNPDSPEQSAEFRALQAAGRSLGIQLHVLQVRAAGDFDAAFATATRLRAGALVTFGDGFTFTHRARILELAARAELPAMYAYQEFVDAGGLMAYGPNLPDLFRRAAVYVDKILKGARPHDLPIEQPTRFELTINRRTELLLGLQFSDSFLMQAQKIID